ncbi:MAG TPA: Dabb family protein [Chthonomonadaceae bacterium]|nr:Dabb family protein [Chthonomonadaceae bacterium]
MSSTAERQIVHVVLFRWAETATGAAIDAAMDGLRALEHKIEGIVELSAGENFSDRGKGYTHVLFVKFANRAALEAYVPHPEHQRVVQTLIAPIRSDVLAVDYEA